MLLASGAAVLLLLLLPSAAPARTWGRSQPLPGQTVAWNSPLAPLPAAGGLWVGPDDGGVLAARAIGAAGAGDPHVLGGGAASRPSVAADAAGGAVIAFFDLTTGSVVVDVRGPDGTIAPAATFPTSVYGTPRLAVSPTARTPVSLTGGREGCGDDRRAVNAH